MRVSALGIGAHNQYCALLCHAEAAEICGFLVGIGFESIWASLLFTQGVASWRRKIGHMSLGGDLSILRPCWFHEQSPALGFMNVLSSAVASATRHREAVPNLRSSRTLLLGSDYAGFHRGARFEVISMILSNPEKLHLWDSRRHLLREARLSNQRRMSYKALNDRQRRSALLPFLEIANEISGLLLTVAIDRKTVSVFQAGGRLSRAEPPVEFSRWKIATIERALRIIHLASFMLRGLSCEGQDLLWITDEDEVVANEARLRTFVNTFATVSSHYLAHPMGHVRIGTTRSDTGVRDVEDYVAVCDFVAGALQELLSSGELDIILRAPSLFVPRKPGVRNKATEVIDWFADNSQPLKRITFIVDEAPISGQLRATLVRFHGTRDLDSLAAH